MIDLLTGKINLLKSIIIFFEFRNLIEKKDSEDWTYKPQVNINFLLFLFLR